MELYSLKNPKNSIDVVLDTDAYNEIDDQFAIAYLLKNHDRLNTKALYAAPFFNSLSTSPLDGMEKSYNEIFKILELCGRSDIPVFRGAGEYLKDEATPTVSDAACDLAKRAMAYTKENPLYVVAIGAITNVASALLINPEIEDRIVIVWLGGNSHEWPNTKEFNMYQDIAAARVVMSSRAPFVQLPCMGVVSEFKASEGDMRLWLVDKNPLADYLARNTIKAANTYAENTPWTRVIWDVTAIGWLLNDNDRFMRVCPRATVLPKYDFTYESEPIDRVTQYVEFIKRDPLMTDLFFKLLDK